MLNRIVIMGRMVRDPELRHTTAGVPVANFSIAHDPTFKSEANPTEFYDVTAWRSTAAYVTRWGAKGRLVIIGGKTQVGTYNDRDGNRRVRYEIVADEVYFADSRTERTTLQSAEADSSPCTGEPLAVDWNEVDVPVPWEGTEK